MDIVASPEIDLDLEAFQDTEYVSCFKPTRLFNFRTIYLLLYSISNSQYTPFKNWAGLYMRKNDNDLRKLLKKLRDKRITRSTR